MSIEDGFFLAHALCRADPTDTSSVHQALQAYEDRRKPHTSRVVNEAYMIGRAFHHTPAALRPIRDFVYDHTPLLQWFVGDKSPDQICAQLDEIESVAAQGNGC